jgi:hypothetical protein
MLLALLSPENGAVRVKLVVIPIVPVTEAIFTKVAQTIFPHHLDIQYHPLTVGLVILMVAKFAMGESTS